MNMFTQNQEYIIYIKSLTSHKSQTFHLNSSTLQKVLRAPIRNYSLVSAITIESFCCCCFYQQQGITFSFQVVAVWHYETTACQILSSSPSKQLSQCFTAIILWFITKAWREQLRWYCKYYHLYLSWVVSSLLSRFTPCKYHYKGQNKSRKRCYLWSYMCLFTLFCFLLLLFLILLRQLLRNI